MRALLNLNIHRTYRDLRRSYVASIYFTVGVVLFALSVGAQAAGRDQLNAFTRSVRGLETRFEQSVMEANGKISDRSKGSMKMSAPRQLLWIYDAPHPQRIVADGNRVWIYDPELAQVTVRSQGLEEQTSPLAILIDNTQLDKQFKVSEGGKSQNLEWVVLEPRKKDSAGFDKIRLGFKSNSLVQMEMLDGFGRKTALKFSAWKRNPSFARGTFAFTPPKGVDVVGDVGQDAQVTPIKD
jgi:outer membrane lipoprotein carrier protein